MKLRGIIIARQKGNCFASCVMSKLQLQGDLNSINDSLAEGKFFNCVEIK